MRHVYFETNKKNDTDIGDAVKKTEVSSEV